jgi:hypothetical protein
MNRLVNMIRCAARTQAAKRRAAERADVLSGELGGVEPPEHRQEPLVGLVMFSHEVAARVKWP